MNATPVRPETPSAIAQRNGGIDDMDIAQSDGRVAARPAIDRETLAATTIRDLVEAYPATLSILAPLGIDLCCGGAFRLGEALELHGLDRDVIVDWIARTVGAGETD
jgi:hypothetical protein